MLLHLTEGPPFREYASQGEHLSVLAREQEFYVVGLSAAQTQVSLGVDGGRAASAEPSEGWLLSTLPKIDPTRFPNAVRSQRTTWHGFHNHPINFHTFFDGGGTSSSTSRRYIVKCRQSLAIKGLSAYSRTHVSSLA